MVPFPALPVPVQLVPFLRHGPEILLGKTAALTEALEELRSEKNLIPASLAYPEKDTADKFSKDIPAMELDAALNEYAELREQAPGFDQVRMYEARQAVRRMMRQAQKAEQTFHLKKSELER